MGGIVKVIMKIENTDYIFNDSVASITSLIINENFISNNKMYFKEYVEGEVDEYIAISPPDRHKEICPVGYGLVMIDVDKQKIFSMQSFRKIDRLYKNHLITSYLWYNKDKRFDEYDKYVGGLDHEEYQSIIDLMEADRLIGMASMSANGSEWTQLVKIDKAFMDRTIESLLRNFLKEINPFFIIDCNGWEVCSFNSSKKKRSFCRKTFWLTKV